MNKVAYLGVIEGFYGKSYNLKKRLDLLDFLRKNAYSFYIYAPKTDKNLRSDLSTVMEEGAIAELNNIGCKCKTLNLDFGLGISPLNLSSSFNLIKDRLLTRIESYCKRTNANILALLFDDIKIENSDIGTIQNRIIKEVYDNLPSCVSRMIVCPSFYSDDPILEKIFGKRPQNYFSELTDNLPFNIDFFWTGSKVLSPDITENDITHATKLLGRKPFIWDNYPVNDGKKISDYLFLSPFNGRKNLYDKVAGHAVNPMLEMYLSFLPLVTLPLIYQGKSDKLIEKARQETAAELFGPLSSDFMKNQEFFEKIGLSHMDQKLKENIILSFSNCKTPAAIELIDFLNGVYEFDPACLT